MRLPPVPVVVSIVVLAGASAASADIVLTKFDGVGQGQNVKITYNGTNMNVFAGQLRHTISSGTGVGADMVGQHLTFCTDLRQYVQSAFRTFDVVSVEDAPDWSHMGEARELAVYALYGYAGNNALRSNAAGSYASAFQVALWEIITDYNPLVGLSSLDLAHGDFRLRDGATALKNNAANFFTNLWSGLSTPVQLAAITSPVAQDQIILGFSVPAPGATALALAIPLAVARRRRIAPRA